MIHYQLRCSQSHEFDGWFKDSAAFEKQARGGLVECPECGDSKIERALMAPAVPKKGRAMSPPAEPTSPPPAGAPVAAPKATAGPLPAQVFAMLQRMRSEVEKNCDYVGGQFADEARKIHRGESEKRGIYGEATPEQAEALAEDGIEVSQIPWVPRADG
jgi:hypothetical protein